MDKCFDGESKGAKRKRNLEDKLWRGCENLESDDENTTAKRQCAWMARLKDKKKRCWRPKKTYRTASKRWLTNTDCQIRFSVNKRGWRFLKFDPKGWTNWRYYPFTVVAMDLGSDGVFATNWLLK